MSLIKTISNNSIFIFFFKKLYIWYCDIELCLDNLFKNSQIHKIIQKFWQAAKVDFRHSFLGKIADDLEGENISLFLYNSKFVNWLSSIYRAVKNKPVNHFKTSAIINFAEEVRKELCYLPIKTSSILLTTAILSNIFFSILLNKEIKLVGWALRIAFLFLGLTALFCSNNWEDIKDTSFILKRINNTDKKCGY